MRHDISLKFNDFEMKIALLLLVTVILLFTGSYVRRLDKIEYYGKTSWFNWMLVAGIIRSIPVNSADLAKTLKVFPGQDPWKMAVAELTHKRAAYNFLTKPGFEELALLLLLGTGLLYAGAETFTWAWQGSLKQLKALGQIEVSIEIAGTTRITQRQGVIYVYNRKRVSGEPTRADYHWEWVPIRLVVVRA